MKVRFNGKDQAEFYPELKRKVEDYFKSNKIGKNANAAMIFKSVFFLSALVVIYLLLIFGNFSLSILLLLAILLGMTQSFIGFNVAHDAIHGSYSANRTVNKLMGFWFNIIGANA